MGALINWPNQMHCINISTEDPLTELLLLSSSQSPIQNNQLRALQNILHSFHLMDVDIYSSKRHALQLGTTARPRDSESNFGS
jgi:hypothetical protein